MESLIFLRHNGGTTCATVGRGLTQRVFDKVNRKRERVTTAARQTKYITLREDCNESMY